MRMLERYMYRVPDLNGEFRRVATWEEYHNLVAPSHWLYQLFCDPYDLANKTIVLESPVSDRRLGHYRKAVAVETIGRIPRGDGGSSPHPNRLMIGSPSSRVAAISKHRPQPCCFDRAVARC